MPIWTTTPWTLPASLAVTLGPELDYVLVEGPARFGMRTWLVLAEALAEKALARYGVIDQDTIGAVATARISTVQARARDLLAYSCNSVQRLSVIDRSASRRAS